MEIIKLDPSQQKQAANIIAASFYDYPVFKFYFPDPKRRTRYLAWYLGNVVKCALRYGEVYTTPQVSGVVFILPPGHTKISLWEYVQNGFLLTPFLLGFTKYKQSMECEEFGAAQHERIMQDRPHYYLWGLAVDPKQKRSGIGSALMEPILKKADIEKKPIYLETHDEKNVAYYQRMGFYLVHSDTITKYNLSIWCMVREPL